MGSQKRERERESERWWKTTENTLKNTIKIVFPINILVKPQITRETAADTCEKQKRIKIVYILKI